MNKISRILIVSGLLVLSNTGVAAAAGAGVGVFINTHDRADLTYWHDLLVFGGPGSSAAARAFVLQEATDLAHNPASPWYYNGLRYIHSPDASEQTKAYVRQRMEAIAAAPHHPDHDKAVIWLGGPQ